MKIWNVSAFFPEVKPAHQAQQSATVEASDIPCAARRGLEEVLALPAISGKHISMVKLTIVVASKKE